MRIETRWIEVGTVVLPSAMPSLPFSPQVNRPKVRSFVGQRIAGKQRNFDCTSGTHVCEV